MKRWLFLGTLVWLLGVGFHALPSSQNQVAVAALPGITAREFSEFRLGLDDFTEVETAEEGLGPAFNGTSCAVCHNLPVIGGGGVILEVRAGYTDERGDAIGLNPQGDTLIHMLSTPSHTCQPAIPEDATVIARRAPIPLFGAGLVEAIPDQDILALADPDDRNRDGISGRAVVIREVGTDQLRVGRFGWKAQHATLLAFGADAYRNEMGITNDLFPAEFSFGISAAQMRFCDPIPDPEDIRDPFTQRRGIDNFESFMKLLAPLPRGPIDAAVLNGEKVFAAIGCVNCHVPQLTTAASTNRVFDRKPVALFSDLLVHDIGTGDGIRQGPAGGSEIRTPALWGLRFRRPLMHDGSAATILDAILQHRNEAALARAGYDKLSPEDRQLLLAFLKSL